MLKYQIVEVSHKFGKESNKIKHNFPLYIETLKSMQRDVANFIQNDILVTCEYVIVTDSELNMYDLVHPSNWSFVESQDIDQYRPKVEKFKGTPTLKTFEELSFKQEMTITFRVYKVEY